MSRLVKIVDNKYVQIEEYKNPNICFNTNEYDNFEDYCTLRETFDPFEIFYENQELKKQLDKAHDELYTLKNKYNIRLLNQISENIEPDCEDYYLAEIETKAHKYDLIQTQQKEFIKYLEDRKNELARGCNNTCEDKFDEADDILQEYKSIIGVSDENNKQ